MKHDFSLNELRKEVDTDGSLDLSVKELKDKEVPVKELGEILALRSLDLSNNYLESLAENFASSLFRLTRLDLSKNKLVRLPGNFGRLQNLEHLDLYKNQLTKLPSSFSNLKKLKWLDLKSNPLTDPRLQKAAELCLTPKGCGDCARRTVVIMTEIQGEEERVRQENLRKERERETNRKKAEEARQERIKQEKKLAKEKRKAEQAKARAEAANAEKNARPVECSVNGHFGDSSQSGKTKGKEKKTERAQQPTKSSRGICAMFFKFILLTAMFASAALVGLVVMHAGGDYSEQSLRRAWESAKVDSLSAAHSLQLWCSDKLTSASYYLEDLKKSDTWIGLRDSASAYLSAAWKTLSAYYRTVADWIGTVEWKKKSLQALDVVSKYVKVGLEHAGELLKTYGPIVHRTVRDYYVWFVTSVYNGVIFVSDHVYGAVQHLF